MKKSKSYTFHFIGLVAAMFLLLVVAILHGSIQIPFHEMVAILSGFESDPVYTEIIRNHRLPKALTAVLAGASLSVAGLLMQTLFRNPLADPYILGVSSGAGLGVALTMMSASFLPSIFVLTGWSIISAAFVGASFVLLLVILVSYRISNAVTLLIVGIMFGTIASSIVSILQISANPDAIKLYVIWTFGSLSAVGWDNMSILAPVVAMGLILALALHKNADGLLLGENYATGLGINIKLTRVLIVVATGILAGSITAFTGPIAFVGVAIPHLARGIFRTSQHKILIPACILIGAILLLVCDIVTQIPKHSLPINTVSALLGAPVILWIILRKK